MNKKPSRKRSLVKRLPLLPPRFFVSEGIKASSVMDVMKGAGLTVGGFYNHFDSKEELFVEALRNAASATWDPLLKSAKGDSPRARTVSVIRQYLSRKHRDNKETGCLLPSAAPEVAREGEPYRSALENELSDFVSGLANMLDAGVESREKALGLIALMYGALSLSRAVAGTRLSDEFLQAGKKLGEQALAEEEGEGSRREEGAPIQAARHPDERDCRSRSLGWALGRRQSG